MIETLLGQITEDEYCTLNTYRNYYAYEDDIEKCKEIPIRDVLVEWANSNVDLYQLLGNQLMLTKDFEFNKSTFELNNQLNYLLSSSSYKQDEIRNEYKPYKFFEAFRDWYNSAFPIQPYYWNMTKEQEEENSKNIEIKNSLVSLISTWSLAENKYTGDDFSIVLPNGKPYKIRSGCKPVKALGKIATAFDIPYFEDFRISHSLVHNQKRIKGTLTLSIHPLDYWTMSDNNCDWESCMSWRDQGGYRQGTVEMMNSPCVIVAYIAASENMRIDNSSTWNNKKWRQLFIVNKDVILGIKAYPFQNEELSISITKWIKELAETNMGWKYLSKEPQEWTSTTKFTNPKSLAHPFRIGFCSNNMYTDVGCLKSHPIYIGVDLVGTSVSAYDKCNFIEFNYSGASQCMCCGIVEPDLNGTEALVCTGCDTAIYCSECGDRIRRGEEYYVHGYKLCRYCYEDNVDVCTICEEDEFANDLHYITPFLKLTEETKEWIKETKMLSSQPIGWDLAALGCIDTDLRVCDNCIQGFSDKFLKPDCSTFHYRTRYSGTKIGFYLEDLNEEGLELLGYDLVNDFKNGKPQKKMVDEYFYDIQFIEKF